LVLELHRLTAHLTRVGLMSRSFSGQVMRVVRAAHTQEHASRHAFVGLLLDVLIASHDGTLREDVHFVRRTDHLMSMHPDSVARALYRGGRGARTAREIRRLFLLGRQRYPDVVVAVSARERFGEGARRRRTVVLDIERAAELTRVRS
jgi:hypothetical protein